MHSSLWYHSSTQWCLLAVDMHQSTNSSHSPAMRGSGCSVCCPGIAFPPCCAFRSCCWAYDIWSAKHGFTTLPSCSARHTATLLGRTGAKFSSFLAGLAARLLWVSVSLTWLSTTCRCFGPRRTVLPTSLDLDFLQIAVIYLSLSATWLQTARRRQLHVVTVEQQHLYTPLFVIFLFYFCLTTSW